MTKRLFLTLSLCLFIHTFGAENNKKDNARVALRPAAPIAIPQQPYNPQGQAPLYTLPGIGYGTSPRVTPGSTPVGTPPRQAIIK